MEKKYNKFPNPGNEQDKTEPRRSDSLSSDEQILLQNLKDGDPEAFEIVFSRWESILYNYLHKLIGSAEDARDISQETFAKLWTHRHSIDTTKNIRNYIFLIAKQVMLNTIRSQRRHEALFSNESVDLEEDYSFENRLQAEQTEALLEYHIQRLPEATRKVFDLHYKEGLAYEQIARRLGISVGNVKSQIYKARQQLKNVLMVSALIFLSKFL